MYIPPEVKRRIWIACGIAPFLLPGWSGRLVPIDHDTIILEAQRHDSDELFGVSNPGQADGEEWHSRYMGSSGAEIMWFLNLRQLAPRVVPPTFVAHIPPGRDLVPTRADGYFRVETSWRWPWWWPGGGVDWTLPNG